MARKNYKHKNDEAVRAAVATILSTDISDPRLFLITVTGAQVSPDKSVANIYVSCEPERYDEVLAGLQSAKGRIRTLLGHALSWRNTPDLRFFIDEAIDAGERIAAALAADVAAHPVLAAELAAAAAEEADTDDEEDPVGGYPDDASDDGAYPDDVLD
ncbi:MAG: 30S ribosome-binding factor RbfA [Actinomycetes bacterium]|jgi:ribosome-binding factor A|nr:30S ribosome-binding factor RbfA [Actinomycetes bacterium]